MDEGTAPSRLPDRLRPRRAASLILLDRSGSEPRVLMGRRHERHVFLPGKYVFPGGRVERGDSLMPVATPLHPAVSARIATRPTGSRAAVALAAVRETFEETGLALGLATETVGAGRVPAPWRDYAASGIRPDLAALRLVARALTPTGFVRRFDTHFFCLDASSLAEHRLFDNDDGELVDLAWVPLASARTLDIVDVTRLVLDEVERRLASDLDPDAPVPFFIRRGAQAGR